MAFATRLITAALVAACGAGVHAQTLDVRAESGRIRVTASKPRFLTGASLERLRNGATVVFAVQVTLLTGSKGTVLARSAGRFAVSFDIWEEKFAVTRLGEGRKSVSHVGAAEAEAWCLESLSVTSAGLSADAPFWVRLDVRPQTDGEARAPNEEAGVTLARLVELFSRPQREGETRVQAEAGPLRLRDLR